MAKKTRKELSQQWVVGNALSLLCAEDDAISLQFKHITIILSFTAVVNFMFAIQQLSASPEGNRHAFFTGMPCH